MESNQVMFYGIAGSPTARRNLYLGIDRGQVRIDRPTTDDELFRNECISQALCYEAQHLHLASRQSVGISGS